MKGCCENMYQIYVEGRLFDQDWSALYILHKLVGMRRVGINAVLCMDGVECKTCFGEVECVGRKFVLLEKARVDSSYKGGRRWTALGFNEGENRIARLYWDLDESESEESHDWETASGFTYCHEGSADKKKILLENLVQIMSGYSGIVYGIAYLEDGESSPAYVIYWSRKGAKRAYNEAVKRLGLEKVVKLGF